MAGWKGGQTFTITLTPRQMRKLDEYRNARKQERFGKSLQYASAICELLDLAMSNITPKETIEYRDLCLRVERIEERLGR